MALDIVWLAKTDCHIGKERIRTSSYFKFGCFMVI